MDRYKKGYNLEKGLIEKAKEYSKQGGIIYLIRKVCAFTFRPILIFYGRTYSRYMKPKKFTFNGIIFDYFYHNYNYAYKNERTVEVPISIEFVKSALTKGKRILEVGNVLSHYYPVKWDVLDKFEVGVGIINEDVVDFRAQEKYDLILSISTMEHVGFDEDDKDPNKIIKSIDNLKNNCLNFGGKIIITVPIGYNKEMDQQIFTDKIKFDEKYYLKRLSKANEWKQTNFEDVKDTRYGYPFIAANAVLVGIIKK